jgi:predicted ATPase with chaperone activity
MNSLVQYLADPGDGAAAPEPPATLAETGLVPESIDDLLLKTLYVQGARTGRELADALALPFDILDERMLLLQEQRRLQVVATVGPNRGSYRFNLSDAGHLRAQQAMAACQYVGPAPVPVKLYEQWVLRQGIGNVRLTRSMIEAGFTSLVLDPAMFDTLGPAVNSARSVFLHGEAGNGKTTVAEAMAHLIGGVIYIPYAVEISGQIMVLFDPSHHEPVADQAGGGDAAWLRAVPAHDPRFIRVHRPVVTAGGELTMDQLDLQFDYNTKMYQAPFQLKAAGGVLIIDDFGRQRVPAHELLNRWIVPLEKRYDYLSLHTGVKFRVPFESLLIFATNLEPEDLVDEAFLRRIQYKLYLPGPTREAYTEIFRRVCAEREIPFDPAAVDTLYRDYYGAVGIQPRACHPRDIADHVLDVARYEGTEPVLSPDYLRRACEAYFLVMAGRAMQARTKQMTGQPLMTPGAP